VPAWYARADQPAAKRRSPGGNTAVTVRRFAPFFHRLRQTRIAALADRLERITTERLMPDSHGDLPHWLAALDALPDIEPNRIDLAAPCIRVESDPPLDDAARGRLSGRLDTLHPWRKGPFCLHAVQIDAEWRSDWKWARLAPAVAPLDGRLVLDVGSGNGYYGFRALGEGAALVLGIDPTLRFVLQFLAVNHFINDDRLAVLPLADSDFAVIIEQQSSRVPVGFDTVFSMGVLYHRREPTAHLRSLRRWLRPGGELVLETLILDRPGRDLLVPPGRYAQMRNVHAIPTLGMLTDWLAAAGLQRIRCVDITPTTTDEQRATGWMRFQSLADFLDADDPMLTVEGHPAPRRAIVLAAAPAAASAR
jgi:tRNA (mo5U34)-methyltransferase